MSPGLGLAVTIGLLLLNGFFVGAEFALVAARRSGVELLAEQGSRRAMATLRAMEQLSVMMAGAQLGITVCSLALGAVSEPMLAHLLEPLFHRLGLPDEVFHPIAFVLALLMVTVLHVVFGETVPKNITLAGPEQAALWLGPPLAMIVRVFRPLIWGLNGAGNLGLRAVGVQPRAEVASTVTRGEVAGLVDHAHAEGLLESADRDLLAGAIAFDEATARDLTLPLDRVHCLPPDASVDDAERLAARTGVTRFPVRDGDRLTGYVHLKDTLGLADRNSSLADEVIRPMPDVTADTSLADSIEIMRTAGVHIARVRDAGRTVGVLTLDDVLASLTGP